MIVRPAASHRWFTSFRVWGPALHVLAIGGMLWSGVTQRALVLGVTLYWVRMFGMTGGYHRYFAHRSYKTSRAFQLFLGCLGCLGVERGPLWWAAMHRAHHRHSDTERDPHSPSVRGVWGAHWSWLSEWAQMDTDLSVVKDLAIYPELRWLDSYFWVIAWLGVVGCGLYAGWSGVFVGAFASTCALWHGTFSINSLAHVWGSRRYATPDDSRNNLWLALITMGEGWHNNHHRYPSSCRQGFYWWEIDASYYIIRALAAVGLVWDLKKPPARI